MKNLTIPSLLVLAASLFACGEKPAPKVEIRVESPGEALRNDNQAIAARLAEQKAAVDAANERQSVLNARQQFVSSLAAIGTRWLEAITEASRSVRSNVGPVIKKLEVLKGEADAVAVNDCTAQARAMLVDSMATAIDAYTEFSKETGNASESVQQKVLQSSTRYAEYEKQLALCR